MQGSAWRWSGRCRSPPRVPWWSAWGQIREPAVPCTGLRAHHPRRGLPHTGPSPLGRLAAASRSSREVIEVSCQPHYMHIHRLSSAHFGYNGNLSPSFQTSAANPADRHYYQHGNYGPTRVPWPETPPLANGAVQSYDYAPVPGTY